MGYGSMAGSLYQQAGTYTERILKGAKPLDLSIEQNIKYELVINLKTTKALSVRPETLCDPSAAFIHRRG